MRVHMHLARRLIITYYLPTYACRRSPCPSASKNTPARKTGTQDSRQTCSTPKGLPSCTIQHGRTRHTYIRTAQAPTSQPHTCEKCLHWLHMQNNWRLHASTFYSDADGLRGGPRKGECRLAGRMRWCRPFFQSMPTTSSASYVACASSLPASRSAQRLSRCTGARGRCR